MGADFTTVMFGTIYASFVFFYHLSYFVVVRQLGKRGVFGGADSPKHTVKTRSRQHNGLSPCLLFLELIFKREQIQLYGKGKVAQYP